MEIIKILIFQYFFIRNITEINVKNKLGLIKKN